MTSLTKKATALGAALLTAATLVTTPVSAGPRGGFGHGPGYGAPMYGGPGPRHHGGGNWGGVAGVAGLFIAGAVIINAMRPRCWYEDVRVDTPRGERLKRMRVCNTPSY